MADSNKSHATQPPPDRGHPMPRRATPENSLTLQNHGIGRGGSAKPTSQHVASPLTKSPLRNSSDESHDTDAKKWFDRSNKKPAARFDGTPMEVDPPFFQKESDSSNEEQQTAPLKTLYPFAPHGTTSQILGPRPPATQSSRADDFRSVIDDLTVENKRLKEELKRFKQFGSDSMNKEKLFEIKMHGIPRRKRRELEATLRDFAASLGDGSTDASPSRKRSSKHGSAGRGSSTSNSKHPSSSTSNSRPVDSAYASASTGPSSAAPNSSSASLGRPSIGHSRSSEQKVDAYLKGIPEGLYPQGSVMSEREKKKWVVKRLEQLFTGQLIGTQLAPLLDRQMSDLSLPPVLESSREAHMQLGMGKKSLTRDRSTNDSNGEQTESRDIGTGTGTGSGSGSGSGGRSGNNGSSPGDDTPEQRPTRVRDLDPNRTQVPSDNMDYMRHVSGTGEGSTAARDFRSQDVSMDAEGWFHLNLLCNMAQLHMMNVTPAFVRTAVTEKSTRFQLSPDGQKIRWRGGTEGTKFNSESSGDNMKQSPATDESEASNENGQRKRRKVDDKSGKSQAKLGPQAQRSTGDFHYKPIFAHQQSSMETSMDESGSQVSADESKPPNNSRWSQSGTGSSGRKRKIGGAIVYYSGAPFCTDLSGDTGDVSPTTYMISTGREQSTEVKSSVDLDKGRPIGNRTLSGSCLPFRPLVDGPLTITEYNTSPVDSEPDLVTDHTDDSDDLDFEFPWCDEPEKIKSKTLEPLLEPCGLGGVTPEDHFAVLAVTRHPRNVRFDSDDYDATEAIVNRLAIMSTASPQPSKPSRPMFPIVKFDFVSAKIRHLKPMPLPQPAMFYPPFSTSSESEAETIAESAVEADDDEMYDDSPAPLPSKRANRSKSNVNTYPEAADLSSNDEEDDAEDDNGYEASVGSSVSPRTRLANVRRRQKSVSGSVSASAQASGKSVEAVRAGSSLATAGDVGSGYHTQSQDEDA